MYKEYVKTNKTTKIISAVIILSAIILMDILNRAIIFFNLPFRSIIQLVILAVMAAGVYMLIRNVISEYEYTVTDTEFVVKSSLGDNEKQIVHIPLGNISCIVRKKSNEAKKSCDGIFNAKKSFSSPDIYICFFESDKKTYKLIFEPSEKLLSVIKNHSIDVK